MGNFEEIFSVNTESRTDEKFIVQKGSVRLSVLTPRLLRVEFRRDKKFCDLPTQTVWYRNFGSPQFSCHESEAAVTVTTEYCSFEIKKSNGRLKSVEFKDGKKIKNFKNGNLCGTARTLDFTYGKISIGEGILSENGVAVLDDGKSLVICGDGFPVKASQALSREEDGKDYYIFAYGRDYKSALRDFFKLTGSAPLLPRYVFGNLWSRYKAYSQQEYLDLMNKFQDEKIPLTVATVDMDWHWVKVTEKFGESAKNKFRPKNISELNQGWTGYSWNTDLFPDYKDFLHKLKNMKLHTTLNVHPSMGVRWFEDAYKNFAEYLGMDPSKKEQIKFDLSSKKFIEGYFKFLHHPFEKDGVDFWWIDWQQGKKSGVDGLDPLWALNHYHSLDMKSRGKRPLTLSRFAGAGSHRYPLGFSGDTAIYWSALKFQPYFTATASNIGYGWWSHDIGGHRGGIHDGELYLRWLWFGVFSPINRLHSTSNELMGKEPWNYPYHIYKCAAEALRLRKRLIPYLYSMNYRCFKNGETLLRPMYYEYPEEAEAYKCGNEYFFGTELIAAPITEKADKKTSLAKAEVWLPEGIYTDIFTGAVYKGGQKINMYRDINSIPVLAKEGAIIPLDIDGTGNGAALPPELEILIFNGNNSFLMYEDDGESRDYERGRFSLTEFTLKADGDRLEFKISTNGCAELLPNERAYTLSFRNIESCGDISVSTENGAPLYETDCTEGFLKLKINQLSSSKNILVSLCGCVNRKNTAKKDKVLSLLSRYDGFNGVKNVRVTPLLKNKNYPFAPKILKSQLKETENML